MLWWEELDDDELRWEDVGAVDDWDQQGVRLVAIGARQIGVYRRNDTTFYALKDRCPHAGAPLHQGVAQPEGIACPKHGWVFDWQSGQGPGECHTTPYPVKVVEGRVLVGV